MGEAADAAAPVDFFAFFFLAISVPDFAGAADAAAEGADDAAGAVLCANAAAENAAATSAATKYFMEKLDSFADFLTTPVSRADAINAGVIAPVDNGRTGRRGAFHHFT